MKSQLSWLLPIAILLGGASVIEAQELQQTVAAEPAGRPRIGLVLGGGGARGAAHIGVLQELERRRVPIHAIAGTSMGAVVGGLYASGRTPAELETLINSIDWADAFIDTPKREDLSFRRKQDDAAFPVKLELGVSDGSMQIPKGLVQGQKLQLILREQLLHVNGIEDFDDLPTPFRAVASDIETGLPYVMSQGDLALAVRASMSAPGIFAPVVVDGHTLVDGGLVGNVPVSVIEEMDVDIIIAVDVEFPLYAPDELQSALAITEQMLTILIRKETLRQLSTLGEDDILIRPELGDYGSTNFVQIAEVVEPGRAATSAQADRLAGLSVSATEYRQFLVARNRADQEAQIIDFIRIVDDSPISASVLQARLKTEVGDPVDPQQLEQDIKRLYGLNVYEHVGYRLVQDGGQTGVEFHTRAKSWGPNFLKFGLSLEDDFEGSTAFNVSGRLTTTGINPLGAEWRNDVQIGTNPRFNSEFFQPLSFDSRYFVASRLDLEQRNLNTFSAEDTIARYRFSEAELGLDFGRTIGRWGEFRIGAFRGKGEARVKVGDPLLPNFSFDQGGVVARLGIDTLDDAQFPKSGSRANVAWLLSRPGLGADNEFDTVVAEGDTVWSWGRDNRNTMQLGLEYATTNGSGNLVQDYFTLGGFLRLSGLERDAISGPYTGLARLVYYREVGQNGGVFDMPLYLGGSVEAGNAWRNRSEISFSSMIVNGSLFAGVDTFLGRLFLAAGFSEEGDSSFYLFFGNPVL
jgi:NTE family protein